MKVNKEIFRYVMALALITALILLLYITNIGCPIRAVTGIPCPTCGFRDGQKTWGVLATLLGFSSISVAETGCS